MRNKIVAVIVTRNRIDKLKKAVRKIIAQPIYGVVVVNNLSTDETSDWLNSQAGKKLVVYHATENLGGAGGFHFGIRIAVERYDSDWIVCFDDDAFPDDNAIHQFQSLEFDNTVGGVAAAVYFPNGRICQMNRPFRNPFKSVGTSLLPLLMGKKNYHLADQAYAQSDPVAIDASSFVGCFLKTDLIRSQLGLPRKELFLYTDDLNYTLQIGKLHHKLLFAPSVKFYHDCETVEQSGVVYPIWKLYYLIRNNIELLRELSAKAFPFLVVIKILTFLKMIRLYNDKRLFLKILRAAVVDGIRRDFSKDLQQIQLLCHEK